MNQTATMNRPQHVCRTLRVEECATILGIGRSAAYSLVREAEASNGNPFKVMRVGNSLLISKKSFDEYMDAHGL